MKKLLPLFALSIVLLMSSFIFLNKNNTVKHENLCGKTDSYDNITELELASSIIVKGRKVSEYDKVELKYGEDRSIKPYTLSSFKIEEIIKDQSDMIIEIDQEIKIIENEYFDESKNTIYHIGDYIKMQNDNEYILFLNHSNSKYYDWYIPTGVTFGKIPLDPSEEVIFKDSLSLNEEYIQEKVADEVREKYIKLDL